MYIKLKKKQCFIFALILAFIGIAGIITLFLTLNPDDFKDNITQSVRKTIGRELLIEGIELSIFPWIGLKLGNVSLANPPNFGKEPMIRIREADIKIRLISLFYGKPETKILVLRQPEIHLIREKDGMNNWDDLLPQKNKSESSKTYPNILKELVVGGVKISEAQITYNDIKEKTSWHISDLNIGTDRLKIGEPLSAKIRLKLDSDKLGTGFSFSSDMTINPNESLLKTENLVIFRHLKSGGSEEFRLTTGLDLDWKKENLSLKNARLSGYGVNIHGNAEATRIFSELQVTSSLNIEEFSPKGTGFSWDTTDATALNTASGSFHLSATPTSVHLSDIFVRADETKIRGKAGLKRFKPITVEFDLTADQLDLDRYLPRPSAPKKEKKHKSEDNRRKTDISGILRIARFKAYKVRTSDARLSISEKDGLLRISPLTASLYHGNLKTDISLDFRGKPSETDINLHAYGVNLGELIYDTSGRKLIDGGKSDINIRLTARNSEFLKTLNGKADMKTGNAVLKGFNIPGLIELTGYPFKALLQKLGVYKEQPAETSIRSLIARFDIKNGKAIARELVMKTPDVHISADGNADLPLQTLDAKVSVDFNQIVNIPVSVTGTFKKPEFFVNPAAVAVNSALNIVGLPFKIGKEIITNPKETGKKIIEVPMNIGEGILKGAGDLLGIGKNKEKKK